MFDESRLQEHLAAIRLLIVDVDGVLTDNGIILGDSGEYKRFDARDGAGIKYLLRSGVEVAIVSGRRSRAVECRAEELGLAEVHQGILSKWPTVADLLERKSLSAREAAYIGDDLMDLPVMRQVGVGIAVANASAELLERADWITARSGGYGAVREVAEAILRAQGKWDKIMERYLTSPTRESGAAP